jgi:flagellar motor switch protein FliN/FliY
MTEATASTEQVAPEAPASTGGVDVSPADLPEAQASAASGVGSQIDILLEASVPVLVRLGQVDIQLKKLLQLNPGSVLILDKQAGEPVDLMLRGIRFATANLVVVGDKLGVRIREILAADDKGA